MICTVCNGQGNLIKDGSDTLYICYKCLGNKEYDWIEDVLGVELIRVEIRKYPLIDITKYIKNENPLL